MVKTGMISKKDLELFTYADTPKTAFEYLKKRLPKMLV
jgi:predicted Rossmann-fold nucleotide-binding protein